MLRPYQKQAIDELEHDRDLIYLATGAGKSVIFKSIAKDYLARGLRVCFVVYGKSIVDQAARKHFNQITDSICMVMGSSKYKPNEDLYCCSISTLSRSRELREKLISVCDVFIIDEAHNATSDQYKNFLNEIPESKPVIGLTATPFYVGNRGHSFWKNVIHPITTLELVQAGHLVMPRVFGPPEDMVVKSVKKTAGDYNNKQLFNANDSMAIYGNILSSWEQYAKNKKTIGFAINKEHAQILTELFNDHGYPSAYADADTPQEKRLRLIRKLEGGDLTCLFNVNIFSTGVDIPSVECGLMARPTQSKVLWIQQVGRPLRPAPNKKEALIIDCGGNCVRLGHPLSDFEPELSDKRKPRESSDVGLELKTCPKCAYLTMPGQKNCIMCGHSFEADARELKRVEAELEEYEFKKEKAEFKNWGRGFIKNETDEEAIEIVDKIVDKIRERGWKRNSLFFKAAQQLENAEERIRFPKWFLKIHTTDTKSISDLSKSSATDYSKYSQQVEVLKDTLASSTPEKDTQLK